MADYKGLTIRIGGDTSQLNAALKSSTKAASSLESQIRQITRAMRFDPGDFGNVDTRMRLTTNRAEALYSKITLLKSAYNELGDTSVSVGGVATSVKKLADSTDNVALKATAAKERYNDMTKNLAANYRELEARAKEAGQAMNLNALSRQGSDQTFETQMAALKQLGVITDDEIQKLREMRATWNEAFDDSEAYKMASQLEGMSVDMQRFESEAKNATATVRELNSVSRYAADGAWSESTAKVKALDSAIGECSNQARAYEAALREDPSNMSAAIGRLKALSNEYDLVNAKEDELSRQVTAYEGRLSRVLATEKNLPQFIQQTGDAWQKAQDELNAAKGEADALHQSLQRLKDAQAPVWEIKQLEAEVRDADAKVDALRMSAEQLDEAFETSKECAELQRLQSELTEAKAHATELQKRMDLSSLGGKSFLNASTIKSAGMTLYSTLTPAITMLGWRAVTAAQDIDTAYRDMRKTVDGTEVQFEKLRQAAIDFSKTHVTSAEQILQIEAIGGELGIATEDLQAFAETVSNLDVATNLNTEEAASSLGKLANITHMTADQYDNYADALVRLGNNGASTEDQIVDISTRMGSMGTIVGMTVPEILALASSIASTGMKTEAAGTAIANTFSDIESAVSNGGDALEAFGAVTEHVGMSAEEFAQTWEDKPIEAFKAFIEGLNRIEEDGGSAVSTLEGMGITGERQKQSILGLMQTIHGLDDNLAMSRDAWDGVSDVWGAAGDAAREAQKKAEGFSGQLAILSNIGNDAMAALAEGATPIIAVFTNIAKAALDMFDGMKEGDKTLAVLALGLGAVIGPALTVVSTFITAKQNISAFLHETSAMGAALQLMKQGFVGMGDAMGPPVPKMLAFKNAAMSLGKALANGLKTVAIIAGISLAIKAITDYIAKLENARDAARNAGDIIGSALGSAMEKQGSAISNLSMSYDDMVSKMAKHNREIQESANETYRNTELISQYGEALKAALDAYNNDKSTSNLANLKTQLELYNDAAGTAITLTEGENGELQLMKDNVALTAGEFDKLTQSMMNAAKAEFFKNSYTKKMEDYYDAMEGVESATRKVAKAEEDYQKAMDDENVSASARLDRVRDLERANSEYENSVKKLEETKTTMGQLEEGMKLMSEAQLENASAAIKWAAENDALQASLWSNGESVSSFANELDALGFSYDDLENNASGIEDVARKWDGSLLSMISGLRDVGIEIDLSKAKIDGLNAVEIDDKTYWVDDMGTVYDQTGKVVGLKNEIGSIDGKEYTITDNGTADAAAGSVEALSSDIDGLHGKDVTVNAEVSGFWEVSNLASMLANLTSKTINVGVNAVGSATGSIASTPYIPRHAAGYIATGPTLTNNGWVGEAGAEAVLNWGTGGTVVPLTNTRYMKPIADAIAKNMNGSPRPDVTNNISITLDYQAGDDARALAMGLMRELENVMSMEA